MNRRSFMKAAALATAAGAVLNSGIQVAGAAESPKNPDAKSIRNYRPGIEYRAMGKTGVMVSPLGFGMMRLPLQADGAVDEELSTRMVRNAIDNGLNYVDTSYVYLGGKSEGITGRILGDGYRDKVYLATKFPWWAMQSASDFDRILDEQLERLQTDVIDFYLLHMITYSSWEGAIADYKLVEKMEKAKERGKVRYIGFSLHAQLPVFKEVIHATPNWEFCQLQLNYHHPEYQAGVRGMRYAWERGLGVIGMESLYGGYLANVPPKVRAVFDAAPVKRSPVEWALDYVWNMPEVGVVLSGMSAMQHVTDNLEYMRRARVGMLDQKDMEVLARAVDVFREGAVPCTGCEYCHPCPANVAIAQNIQVYNKYVASGDLEQHRRLYDRIPSLYGTQASACTGCGECRAKCPMAIDVPAIIGAIRDTFAA